MSVIETHHYDEVCEICKKEYRRKWGENGKVETYHYGVLVAAPASDHMSHGYHMPTIDKELKDVCGECRDKLDKAVIEAVKAIIDE